MTLRLARILPLAAFALLGSMLLTGVTGSSLNSWHEVLIVFAMMPILAGAIFSAVYFADKVAERTGEPLGTVTLTLSVTTIEVVLIVAMMMHESPNLTLARDTVFSIIMIVCNGLVGLCMLLGGLKYGEQGFNVSGASSYLAVLGTIGTITLILPSHAISMPGPTYSKAQLVVVSLMSLGLYGLFLFIQTIRHRDHFSAEAHGPAHGSQHSTSSSGMGSDLFWLVVALISVILLAEKFAVVAEVGLNRLGAPEAVAGIIVALLILAPESLAAIQAAGRDQLQRSVNLALGSALSTIGLTIPAMAAASLALGRDLLLGLGARDSALLALTLLISAVTLGNGRSNFLLGAVHLVIFATYILFVFIP